MGFRHKMTSSGSRRSFGRGSGTHRKNFSGNPMRGGIRL